MMAVTVGDEHVARILLKAKANPKAKDEEGQTALDYANMFEHKDLVKLLMAEGTACASRPSPAAAVAEEDSDAEIETFFAEAKVVEDSSKIEKKKKRRDSKLAVDAPVDENSGEQGTVEPEKSEKKLKKRSSKVAEELSQVDEAR